MAQGLLGTMAVQRGTRNTIAIVGAVSCPGGICTILCTAVYVLKRIIATCTQEYELQVELRVESMTQELLFFNASEPIPTKGSVLYNYAKVAVQFHFQS